MHWVLAAGLSFSDSVGLYPCELQRTETEEASMSCRTRWKGLCGVPWGGGHLLQGPMDPHSKDAASLFG